MKQGYSPTFTNETFSLVHDLDPNQVPILHGSKTAHQNAWRVTIQLYQDTSHVDLAHTKGHTADLETSRTLLNCMISENAKWTTIDLTDFYLGTPLPHPEYISIPISMTQISPRWNLKRGTTNLASLALTAQCLIPGKNASTVSHPQQSVPSIAKTKGALIDNQRVPELLKCDATNLLALKKGYNRLRRLNGSLACISRRFNGSLTRISRRLKWLARSHIATAQ